MGREALVLFRSYQWGNWSPEKPCLKVWANATWTTANGSFKERIILTPYLFDKTYIPVLSQGLHDCSQVRGLLIPREDSLIRARLLLLATIDMYNSYYYLIEIVSTINVCRYMKQKHKSLLKKGPQFWMSFLYNSFFPPHPKGAHLQNQKSQLGSGQFKENHFLLGTVTRCKTSSCCAQHFSHWICFLLGLL